MLCNDTDRRLAFVSFSHLQNEDNRDCLIGVCLFSNTLDWTAVNSPVFFNYGQGAILAAHTFMGQTLSVVIKCNAMLTIRLRHDTRTSVIHL